MIEQEISAVPLITPKRNEVLNDTHRLQFIATSEATYDAISTTMIPQFNTFRLQTNETKNEINGQVSIMAGYVATTKQYRDEANSAQQGAETALASTIQIIEDADITGTSGYTMDAVDSMIDDIELQSFIDFNFN